MGKIENHALRITPYGLRLTDYALRITPYGFPLLHSARFVLGFIHKT